MECLCELYKEQREFFGRRARLSDPYPWRKPSCSKDAARQEEGWGREGERFPKTQSRGHLEEQDRPPRGPDARKRGWTLCSSEQGAQIAALEELPTGLPRAEEVSNQGREGHQPAPLPVGR